MPWKASVVSGKEFVNVEVTECLDSETLYEIIDEVASLTLSNRGPDLLVDARRTDTYLSVTDAVQLARWLARYGENFRKRKFALVGRPAPEFLNTQFFGLCAANRGFQVRAFKNFELALIWLLSEQDSGQLTLCPA